MDVVFAALFALAALSCVAVGWRSWLARRGNQAAVMLTVALAGCTEWSAANVLTTVGLSGTVQIWAVKASYVGIYVTVVGLFLLCQSIVDPSFRPSRAVGALLTAVPVAMVVILVALPVPGAFFTAIRPVGSPSHAHIVVGPLFYVHAGFCYLLLGRAFWVVVRARRAAGPLFRRQLNYVIAGGVVPVVGNVLGVIWPSLYDHRDLTPLFFSMTGLLNAWALRQGLLRIIPVARALVLESIADSVFVIDASGRIVDVNEAARLLVRQVRPDHEDEIVSMSASDLLGPLADIEVSDAGSDTLEVFPDHFFSIRSTVMNDIRGRMVGRVLVCHEISELVRARTEVERQLDLVEQLRGELLEQTLRDPMTGAYNRRYLAEALTSAMSESDRSGRSVAVLMLDIDHFKMVNDVHGHQTGDLALVAMVRTLAGNVRGFDVVARYGGEEFVVVLPGVTRDEALTRAEQLRVACMTTPILLPTASIPTAAMPMSAPGDPTTTEPAFVQVTVSIGCALYPADAADAAAAGADADALIACADHALYLAKAKGRNCVVDASRIELQTAADVSAT